MPLKLSAAPFHMYRNEMREKQVHLEIYCHLYIRGHWKIHPTQGFQSNYGALPFFMSMPMRSLHLVFQAMRFLYQAYFLLSTTQTKNIQTTMFSYLLIHDIL